MSSFSNYLESAVLDAVLRGVSYTSPSNVYLALYSSDPQDGNIGTEISGSGYARQSVTFSSPTGGSASNSAVVTFPTAEDNWGTVTHIGVLDALSGGNLLFHSSLNAPISITIGMRIRFPISSVIVSLD